MVFTSLAYYQYEKEKVILPAIVVGVYGHDVVCGVVADSQLECDDAVTALFNGNLPTVVVSPLGAQLATESGR